MSGTHIDKAYCPGLYHRKRIDTIEVRIGNLPVGAQNPIRIQSMTTTDTMDTEATVAQTIRMVESGAEYVRITAPSVKEARNLALIKKRLRQMGYEVPLIADIHFTPNAAEIAARIVEKVRVNPGNYADRKRFKVIEYTDATYKEELERIHERFSPLVKICKEHGTAMRIGTNHGSLSDRIMSRFGDTPLGMVESAMEFLRICEAYDYDQVVLSMKASNPQVMVQAYRLLMQQMLSNGRIYPLHLGVTEAGEGEDGRIKSAQGIGALLMDGIGDTVRVSLTEEPEYESPVAQFLVDMFEGPDFPQLSFTEKNPKSRAEPFSFLRRSSASVLNLGSEHVPRVIADHSISDLNRGHLADAGYQYTESLDKYQFADMSADYIYLGKALPPFQLPGGLKAILDYATWKSLRDAKAYVPLFSNLKAWVSAESRHPEINFLCLKGEELALIKGTSLENVVIILEAVGRNAAQAWRWMVNTLDDLGIAAPVVLSTSVPDHFDFYDDGHLPEKYQLTLKAKQQLYLAGITGTMGVDGQLDGLMFSPANNMTNRTAFGVLQASRLRITKTEYISCPSCGRTLFDLQETTSKIRKRTEHLKGVKIGIMGCIVNGPGEMADADYGYVGIGVNKIALYRGQTVVERGVQTSEAVDKLIDLIVADGKWIDPV